MSDTFRTWSKAIRCFQSILCVINKVGDSANYLNKIKAYCFLQTNNTKPTDVTYFKKKVKSNKFCMTPTYFLIQLYFYRQVKGLCTALNCKAELMMVNQVDNSKIVSSFSHSVLKRKQFLNPHSGCAFRVEAICCPSEVGTVGFLC